MFSKLRLWWSSSRSNNPRRALPRRRKHLLVEVLEDRITPAIIEWVGPEMGSWAVAANWEDSSTHDHVLPGPQDDVEFGDPSFADATNTDCALTAAVSVASVKMLSNYTHALTLGTGGALTVNDLYMQTGGLALGAGTTVTTSTATLGVAGYAVPAVTLGDQASLTVSSNIDENATLTLTGGTLHSTTGSIDVGAGSITAAAGASGASSAMTAAADITLTVGSLGVTGDSASAPGLIMTAPDVTDNVPVSVGTAGGATGALAVTGALDIYPNQIVNLYAGSTLGFTSGGTGQDFTVDGTINMYGATISSTTEIDLHGIGLNSLASTGTTGLVDQIYGDVKTDNLGALNIGSATVSSELDMMTGSLTIDSGSTSLGNGLNVYAGSLLSFPALPGQTSELTVTANGLVTMYGGTIATNRTRVPTIDMSGTLNSEAGTGSDSVVGVLNASGSIAVGNNNGGLSSLAVTGALTVEDSGTVVDNTGCSMAVGPAMTGDSCTVQGEVDMYGASFGDPAGINLAAGKLITHGSSSGGADTLTSSLTNNGTVNFEGFLHTLTIPGGSYIQGAQGSLVMRIQDPANGVSDLLTAQLIAQLNGTLTVSAQGTLPANAGQWTIIHGSSGVFGDFATKNFPSGHAWADTVLGGTDYVIGY